MKRINTSKLLSNEGYFSNADFNTDFSQTPIAVSPLVSDQYDFALTEDIILLNERKDTAEKLYDIWINSPYYKDYETTSTTSTIPKIPRNHISKIFYYMKNKLAEVKTLSSYEVVLAINEFFDFNYEYVVKKVLSPKIRAEILEDYYKNGMKKRIDENTTEKLF